MIDKLENIGNLFHLFISIMKENLSFWIINTINCCDASLYSVTVALDPMTKEPKARSTSSTFPENLDLSSTTTLSKL